MTRKPKAVEAWAGFASGRIDEWSSVGYRARPYDGQMFAIFRTKREAENVYEDVRRVRITPIKRRTKR